MMWEAAIIGGGPAGSTAAIKLARSGQKRRVDRKTGQTP